MKCVELPKNGIAYLDLFAGAGGLSEGFIRAGYKPIAHIEMDSAACYTLKTRAAYHWLKENGKLSFYQQYLEQKIDRSTFYSKIPENVLKAVLNYEIAENTLNSIFAEVDQLLEKKQLDLIVGGPPCQAYSIAGRSRSMNRMVGDNRNYLYKYYAEFLKRYKPRYFVFENVLGLLSAKDEDGSYHFANMRNLFANCGYKTDFKVLNAFDFGVLQNRRRVILIGCREKTREEYPEIPRTSITTTIAELLSDLPTIHAGEGTVTPVPTKHYEGKYLFDSGIKEYDLEPVTYHQARPNTEQDLEIYRLVVDNWDKHKERTSYMDLPERLRTHNNTLCFLDRFKVVAGDLPYAQTVVAHVSRDGHYYIHPDIAQNRSLTPREVARIQTFPDNFFFESSSGKPSRTLAYKQIGNAVPVCLAYSIAVALQKEFRKAIEDEKGSNS